jgi:hypothetical protein
MKKIIQIIGVTLIMISLTTACTDWAPQQNQVNNDPTKPIVRRLKQLSYTDFGAVVPMPIIRNVNILLRDTLNAMVFYTIINQKDTFLQKIPLNDPERMDMLHECFNQLSEIEEGWEVMPGKEPCVGMRGVNVALIYTTGDTTRFNISGTARCDNSLMPEWSLLDSLAAVLSEENIVVKNGKVN